MAVDDQRIEGTEVILHAIDLTIADVKGRDDPGRDEQLATLTRMREAFKQREGRTSKGAARRKP
jgi:hypothetical protein